MGKMPSKATYDKAEPYEKGFMAYTWAKWPNSQIPEDNPFSRGTVEAELFAQGWHAAILCAQDSEE